MTKLDKYNFFYADASKEIGKQLI